MRSYPWGAASLEARPSHVEVLQLQLLDPRLQHPIGLPQLYQLCVDSVNSEFGVVVPACTLLVQWGVHIELAILRVALCEDALDLVGDHVFVVLPVILENALNQLEALSQSLVLDVECEDLRVGVFLLPAHLLNSVSQLGVCFKQIRNRIHTVNESLGRRIHLLLVLLEIEVHLCALGLRVVVVVVGPGGGCGRRLPWRHDLLDGRDDG